MRTRLVAALAVVLLGAGCNANPPPIDRNHIDTYDVDWFRWQFESAHVYTVGLRHEVAAVEAWKAARPGIDQSLYTPDKGYLDALNANVDNIRSDCLSTITDYNDRASEYTGVAFAGHDFPARLSTSDPVFVLHRASWADYDCTDH